MIEPEFLEAAVALIVRWRAEIGKAKFRKLYRSDIIHNGQRHLIVINRRQIRWRRKDVNSLAEFLKKLALQDSIDEQGSQKV